MNSVKINKKWSFPKPASKFTGCGAAGLLCSRLVLIWKYRGGKLQSSFTLDERRGKLPPCILLPHWNPHPTPYYPLTHWTIHNITAANINCQIIIDRCIENIYKPLRKFYSWLSLLTAQWTVICGYVRQYLSIYSYEDEICC